MNGLDFKQLRVLIVGGKPHAVRTLRTVFSMIGLSQISAAPDGGSGLKSMRVQLFSAVFCDETVEEIDGLPFVVAARRDPEVLDHMMPIFLTCNAARLKQVMAARDIGVTDVLARPISATTIMRKLTLALVKPRPFIAAPDFFGPDRRGQARPTHIGDERRTRKARKVRVAKPEAAQG